MLGRQVEYAVRQIKLGQNEALSWIDGLADVEAQYNDVMQSDIKTVKVWQADCGHYYNARSGRMVTQWPHDLDEYTARTAADDADAYESAASA